MSEVKHQKDWQSKKEALNCVLKNLIDELFNHSLGENTVIQPPLI